MSLDWPEEFDRTLPENRTPYPGGFRVTRSTAFDNILSELGKWGGVTDVQLDTGAEHQKQNPNKPYARSSFDDPGVVVRFQKDGEDMAAACDAWDNPRDNAQDLYHYLHETRMQEQRGTVTAQSEYEKLRLGPGPEGGETIAVKPSKEPHEVLGVSKDAPEEVVEAAARAREKETHPDRGGDREEFIAVQKAKKELLEEGGDS